jgi:protein SCO1/2
MGRWFSLLAVTALVLTASCKRPAETDARAGGPQRPSTNQQIFRVKGVIKELRPDGKTVAIRHEEIINYMPAMTMPFAAKDPKELVGLKAGNAVSFRLTVTDTESWIDQIRKLSPPSPTELPSRGTFRFVRDVEPLQIGDPRPEYHFTNELGQAVSTRRFKGQALAITFIFTRCPLPNFCPLMSNHFAEAQKKLLAMTNGPANWHLLTLSFDPDFDTPVILKAYAQRFGAEPGHWSFLTGDLIDLTAIAEQFGQKFWQEEGALNHNLRTAVVDASGRVRKIWTGNQWTSDELVAELAKGAGTEGESLKR